MPPLLEGARSLSVAREIFRSRELAVCFDQFLAHHKQVALRSSVDIGSGEVTVADRSGSMHFAVARLPPHASAQSWADCGNAVLTPLASSRLAALVVDCIRAAFVSPADHRTLKWEYHCYCDRSVSAIFRCYSIVGAQRSSVNESW